MLYRHPSLFLVAAASLWLLGGLVLLDQQWGYFAHDGAWGMESYAGQAVARVILWPGYRAASWLWNGSPPAVSWLVATVVGIVLSLLLDRLLRKALGESE